MPAPDPIYEIISGYRLSAALRAAVELGLFTAIHKGKKTARGIASEVGASERGVRILLDGLLGSRLVNKKGNSYTISPMARDHLVEGQQEYIGHLVLLQTHPIMWDSYRGLTEAVRKGGSRMKKNAHAEDQTFWEDFARLTWKEARINADKMVDLLKITEDSGPMRVLDVACGSGMYGIAIAEANPEAEVVLLDRANVLRHTKGLAKQSRARDRISFIEGDLAKVALKGPYDLVVASHVLHHFDLETSERIVGRISKATKPRGRIAIQEFIVDDDRIRRRRQLGFSLTMLVWTDKGEAYSFSEVRRLLVRNRYRQINFQALGQPSQWVTAQYLG